MLSFSLKSVQNQISELTSFLTGSIAGSAFPDQSFLFSELAVLAYYDDELADKQAKKMGFLTAKKIRNSNGETIATVIIGLSDTIIAMKGTEGLNDLRVDLDLKLVKDGTHPGRVHDGFRRAADTIWPALAPLIANGGNIWLTGHSMGGAIASILAIRAARGQGPNVQGVFTFGAPRVGNLLYVTGLHTPHHRWVHHHDLVPRIPTKWMGYQHFGLEHYISGGAVVKKTLWNRLKRFLSRLFDRLSLDGVFDHNIVEYRAAIARYKQESANG